jgi:2-hydroxy-3-oxopropionate reductase
MSGHLALIGAGAMGGAIGARLVQTGTPLVVFDLDPDKVAALVAFGRRPRPAPRRRRRGQRR